MKKSGFLKTSALFVVCVFLFSQVSSAGGYKTWQDVMSKRGAVKVFVEEVTNETGDSAVNTQDLTSRIKKAFSRRTSNNFVIVDSKDEANVVFTGTVTQYVWEKDAPITMPLPAGAAIDYLTKKGKHYARMLLHYKLTSAERNKVLKENTVMATLKRRGVTKEKSYRVLDRRMPRMLMRDICRKPRD